MQAALRMKTRVLPGKRIEVTSPELPENADVELIVVLPGDVRSRNGRTGFASAWDYLESLGPVERTPEEWEQVERGIQEEKEAWDR